MLEEIHVDNQLKAVKVIKKSAVRLFRFNSAKFKEKHKYGNFDRCLCLVLNVKTTFGFLEEHEKNICDTTWFCIC